MGNSSIWTGLGAFGGMLILILDSKTALEGAKLGIELCLRSVIPSLFPFFVLSTMITAAFMGRKLRALRPFGRLFGIPAGSESILISSFLGGYPVGAQCVFQAFRNAQLSKEDAEKMLSFCNNAGPSFLFGMAAGVFPHPATPWLLWGIQIISALLVSRLFSPKSRSTKPASPVQASLFSSMGTALKAMGLVCGWVVLFRVLISFFRRWFLWLFPKEIQVGLIGLLELSNGFCELPAVHSEKLRFILCSGMLSFGGLCVMMQTAAVTKGLSLRCYLSGKLLQMLLSILFSICIAAEIFWIPLLTIGICLVIPQKNKKGDSIPQKAIV